MSRGRPKKDRRNDRIVLGRHFSVGGGCEAREGHAQEERMGISVSLLPVWEDIPALSEWDEHSRSDGTFAAICSDQLDLWAELSESECDSERLGS